MIFSLFLILTSFLQPQQSNATYYNTRSGLSSNIIYDVYQDKEGYIWIATDNGLNRFNGYEFEAFYHNPDDSASLSNSIIRSIAEDNDGNLWVGTNNGFNVFDKVTQTFQHYKMSSEIEDVQNIYKDSYGNFWISLAEDLIRFNPSTKEFEDIEIPIKLYAIAIDDSDVIWINNFEGDVVQYHISSNSFTEVILAEKKREGVLLWGKESGSVWTDISPADKSMHILKYLPDLPNKRRTHRLLESSDGPVWLGTPTGLFTYLPEQNELSRFSFGERSSALIESIKCLFEDDNGGIWIGTLNGLFYLKENENPFVHISGPGDRSKIIMGIADSENGIAANIFSENLAEFNIETGNWSEPGLPETFNLNGRRIWAIENVPENAYSLWLGTDQGLYMINPETKDHKLINLPLRARISPGIFSIVRIDNESVWVTGHESITQLSTTTGEVKETITFEAELGLPTIQDVLITEAGVLVATDGAGLFNYSEDSGLRSIGEFIQNAHLLNRTSIWDLYESANGNIYIGASNGLHEFIEAENRLRTISMGNAIGSRIVFSIVEDSEGVLWLGSDNGLLRYDPASGDMRSYDNHDGVVNTEFNRRSILIEQDRIWLGGIDGLTTFNPSEIKLESVESPLYITRFESILSDTMVNYPTFEASEVELPWNHGTIEISFTALNYANPNQIQYRYILTGRNPGWVYSRQNRTARYVQLPSGEYTFNVEMSVDGAAWSGSEATLKVVVHPPFWETIWFRVMLILLVVSLLWMLYRYRVAQLVELERTKLRIASDLHDEIGSGLSSIALTGDLLQKPEVDRKAELISLVSKNARELASSLDNIVWLIDPKKESMGELITRIKGITSGMEQSKVVFREDVSSRVEHKSLPAVFRRNVFLLTKEALNNALKYGSAEQICIDLHCSDKELYIKIKDNGRGFDMEHVNGGNGLTNMRNRARDLYAAFKIDSAPGKGTSIELTVKLP